MFYIIYDLEFTVLRRQQYLAEIIEIGAIKVKKENSNLEIIDFYQSFVRPYSHSTLSKQTLEFTGIRQEDIDRAPSFRKVIEDFQAWIGEEYYYLCSWGPDDKQQLVRHCVKHKLSLDWIKNYNDLQMLFTKRMNAEKYQQVGLGRALEHLSLDFEGTPHRAIHDAYNTSKIFISIFPDIQLEENIASEEQLYPTRVVYKTGDNGNFPFADLAELFKANE